MYPNRRNGVQGPEDPRRLQGAHQYLVRYQCLRINSHFYFYCWHEDHMHAWVLNYCVTVRCLGVSGEKTLLQLYSICVDPDGQRCVPLGCVPLTVGCVGSWSHPFICLQHGWECAIVLVCKASLPSWLMTVHKFNYQVITHYKSILRALGHRLPWVQIIRILKNPNTVRNKKQKKQQFCVVVESAVETAVTAAEWTTISFLGMCSFCTSTRSLAAQLGSKSKLW